MKNIVLTLVTLVMTAGVGLAQNDTMYVMKSGAVIAKYNVIDQVDSVIFYNPDAETGGTELTFDGAKIVVGDLEGNGNLRIEMYNEYGSTKDNPPLDPAAMVWSTKVEITFTLSGVTLKEGAVGSYDTALGIADADWSTQYWGGGAGETKVTGDGTYTVYAEAADHATGLVFVLDLKGMGADIADLGAVTATVTKIVMY